MYRSMADDIRENAMSGGTPARLRGLAANGNSISPTLEEVASAMPVATENSNGLMSSHDKKRGYHWKNQIGPGKVLYVGRFSKNSSVTFSAISGNNDTAVNQKPTPLIFALNNHSSTGILVSKIGDGNKWAYVDDGEYINLYYIANAYIGDGMFIISYTIELIMEFVNTPSEWILL